MHMQMQMLNGEYCGEYCEYECEYEHDHEQLWVVEHGMSSASSSSHEDDMFESGMKGLWSDILDEYEDEQMVRWDHWSGRKLRPDQLDNDEDEGC